MLDFFIVLQANPRLLAARKTGALVDVTIIRSGEPCRREVAAALLSTSSRPGLLTRLNTRCRAIGAGALSMPLLRPAMISPQTPARVETMGSSRSERIR